jgi:hypothetical protein
MFRIPNYFQINMTWDEAVRTIKGRGNGNLLDGMEAMNEAWNDHVNEMLDDDSDFYEHWMYEVNAFNIVFEGMGKLFKEAA